MPSPKINFILAAFAVVLYFIVPRVVLIVSLERHAPSRLQRWSGIAEKTKFTDVLRNCEDALIIDGPSKSHPGYAILSCDAGRDKWNTVMGIFHDKGVPQGKLYLYDYRKSSNIPIPIELLNFPQSETDFHPLGIEYHQPSSTLFVVSHAKAGPRIELFELTLSSEQDNPPLSVKHIRTLEHPLLHTPNSITALSATELYVTNDHYFKIRYHPWLAHLETYLGIPGGSVVHVDLATDTITTEARISFANGIVLLNDTTLAVASTATAKIHLYTIDRGTYKLSPSKTISVPFMPDNLSVDRNGLLLIAGHAHIKSIAAFAHSRARCNSPDAEADKRGCEGTSPSYIAQWTEGIGLRDLYVGDAFSSSTTAVRDVERGIGLAMGLYEKGVMIWGQED